LDNAERLILFIWHFNRVLGLHGNGIIRGDLKPHNVLLNRALEPNVADLALFRFVGVVVKKTTLGS
jgi:serine/threonine protein kinase